MKKIQLKHGLQVSKETLSKLQESQVENVRGGKANFSCFNRSCNTKVPELGKGTMQCFDRGWLKG